MRHNKYNAIKAQSNGITFDSNFEALVYEHLVHLFGEDRILRQIYIPLLQSNELFTSVGWYIDFEVMPKGKSQGFGVEAKGCITAEWLLKYKLFWNRHPDAAERTLIVFPTKRWRQKRGIYARIPQMISLPELPDYLRGRQWI